MNRTVRLFLGLLAAGVLAAPAAGQDSHAPTIVTMSTDANTVLDRIQATMMLTEPSEQAYWKDLKDYLEVFLIGLDRTRPARMDVLFQNGVRYYRLALPIADMKEFRDNNLGTLGIDTRRRRSTLYQLSNAFEGFMRYHPATKYATIVSFDNMLPDDKTSPLDEIAHLLKRKYDVAIEGTNLETGASSIDKRHASYQTTRDDAMAKLKREENETPEDFALRKLFWEIQYDETQRIYAEAKHLLLGGHVEPQAQRADIEIDLSPIAETDLAKSIEQIGQEASRFGDIERSRDPILSVRVNMPLDKMRQDNVLQLTGLLRDRYHKRVDEAGDFSREEKDNADQAIDQFFAIIDDGAKTGRLDMFLEGHANGDGTNTLIGATRAADGTAMIAVLERLGKVGRGNKVELDVAEQGDVKIHRATFPKDFRADLRDFFGDETFLIGTAKETLWFGAGPGALEELKAAIEGSGEKVEAKADAPFLDMLLRAGPWAKLIDKRMGNSGRVEMRRRIIEASRPGDDQLSLTLGKKEERLVGEMVGNRGILRFIGKVLAEFTENLENQ